MARRIRVAVHGALGRMGREVLNAVCHDPELEAVAGVDLKGNVSEITSPDGSSSIPFSTDLEAAIARTSPDVMVDFSVASATMFAARIAAKRGVRLVIGTTGLSSADLQEIESLCRKQRLGAVVAPNFTLGAVVMIHLAKMAARFFDYAEIIEMHHEQKVDAPSGTSLTTAQEMVKARGKDFSYVPAARENLESARGGETGGVAIHSVRLPGLLAHQEIILGAAGQTLTIRHDSINRECYMPGVLLAIKRVVDLKEAIFGLDKLLGL